MTLRSVLLSTLTALCVLAPAAFAQRLPLATEFAVPGVAAYDASIPTPESVIGHKIGTKHTRPEQVVRYFEAVAAASRRVTLGEHGKTWEGRPLIHAIVAAPETDLEAAQAANVRLSEQAGEVGDAALGAMPVVAYMGYSVHGNEASGTEAALLLLYHLAAGRGPSVDAVLKNAVVIIDPMLNPDGRDRFVDWVNSYRSGTSGLPSLDANDREHNEAWPGGRTNHYLFDLNRDWLPLVHPESQGRMALWHAWRPQLSTDFHEMGGNATYFFQPGIPSRNNPNTPERNYELTAEIATYHAAALDRIGQLYYSGESFDDFYYGKGSTYPDVNGSVGILFEQASSRALAVDTDNGRLDYAVTVRNQFATSLSSLDAAVALRVDLLRHQRDFYASAPAFAREAETKAYVFDAGQYPQRASALAEVLRQHRIQVYGLARSVEAGGERFESGAALVVPVAQPQGRLLKAVMERVTTFQDSLFYDVSTWTLPLAFGLRYAEVQRDAADLLGAEWTEAPAGRLVGGQASYAYAISWSQGAAPRALARLQRAGLRARLATSAFEMAVGGARRTFEPGTLIVLVGQGGATPEVVHRTVREAVAEDGIEAVALGTGLTAGGPDLGSRSMPPLEVPRVALLAGSGTDAYSVGEAWHLLTERAGLAISLLDRDDLGRVDLSAYTTVLAVGSFRGLENGATDKLKAWVRDGGVLVATEGAARWAAEQEFADVEQREAESDTTRYAYVDVDAARGAQVVGGAIFGSTLDTSHPLAFGYPARLPLFKGNTLFLTPPESAGITVASYTDDPLLSGYVSDRNLEQIAGGAALIGQRMGRGRVILFDFNPTFRAFWRGTEGLLLNAVFFGRTF